MLGKFQGRGRVHKVLARSGYGKRGAMSASERSPAQEHDDIASHLSSLETESHADGDMPESRLDRKPRVSGGRLTSKARNDLPTKEFAEPKKRKYPINDPNHARNALARVSQFGSDEEKSKVRSAVHKKYPGIGAKKS